MFETDTSYDFYDFESDCSEVMLHNGLMPPNQFISDGKLHRCGTVDKPHGSDGAYILHEGASTGSAPTLWWQNHKTGASDTFSQRPQSSGSCAVTTAEQRKVTREAEQQRRELEQAKREAEQAESYTEAAAKAQEIWDNAYGVEKHPYLTKKGVPATDLIRMTEDDKLIIPVYRANPQGAGESISLQSLQFIDKDGTKRFLTGGKKGGGFLPIPAHDGKDDVLCLCEGYATGMSINMATGNYCLVAFDAGNLMSVGTMLREKCPDWTIVVCADNDVKSIGSSIESVDSGVESVVNNVGVSKALDVALAMNALVAIPPAHEGRATDFNDLHQARGLDAVAACIAEAKPVSEYAHLMQGEKSVSANPIRPIRPSFCSASSDENKKLGKLGCLGSTEGDNFTLLRRTPDDPEPYPVEALGVYGDAAKAIAEHVGAPLAMVANSILGMLSLATQDIANIEYEGRTILTSLYLLSVLGSGERKSSVDAIVMKPVRDHQAILEMEYDEHMKEWRVDNHAYELAKKRAGRGKDYATIRNQLRELGEEPPKPVAPRLMVSNINIEGIYQLYKDGAQSLGLILDEGGILFGGTAFSSENKLKSTATLSSLWTTGSADKVRMGEGSSLLQNKRLTCHIMAQPIIVDPLFSDAVLQEQGFLPRFLIAWPDSMKGTRLKDDKKQGDINNYPAVQVLHKCCKKLLQFPRAVDGEGKRRYIDLPLNNDADKIYTALYNQTELAQAPDGDLREVSNYASRCGEQALRIAAVLTLANNPRALCIDGDTMQRGATLALWYTYEAKRISESGRVSPEIAQAIKLLRWLERREFRLTSQTIMSQNGPIHDGKALKATLQILKAHGYVRQAPKGTLIDGKRCNTAWEILYYADEAPAV